MAGEWVDTALTEVDLLSRARVPLRKLSGGMLQRAAIAAALVHRPEFVMLDEPTVGLDPQQRSELHALLRRLGTSTSVLLSTHLLEDVRATCDRVIVLNDGGVRFHGPVSVLEEAGGQSLEAGYLSVLEKAAS